MKYNLSQFKALDLADLNELEKAEINGGVGFWHDLGYAVGAGAHMLVNYFDDGPLSSEKSGLPAYR